MPGELIGILAMGAFFAVFGFFRLADRGETGCGGCEHASEECGGGSCPMLKDL